MSSFMQTLFWGLVRCVLRLRYRVQVIGAEQLRTVTGPTLVMPNHPAYIDPPLVLSHVRLGRPLRPIVFAGIFRRPLLYPFMRLIGAFEVPDLGRQSHGAREQTLAMIEAMVSGLERGESFLIYPSGHVKRQPEEVLGSARAAAEILERCPQAQVVLVRTSGLWGSSFSYAQTGNPPHLTRCALRGFAWLLASLLWFAPRRKVTMTIEVLDRTRLAGLTRDEINPFLEAWYNQEGVEPATFVPYHHLLGPRRFAFPDLTSNQELALDAVKPATVKAIQGCSRSISADRWTRTSGSQPPPWTTSDWTAWNGWTWPCRSKTGSGSVRTAWPATVGELWALAEGRLGGSGEAAAPAPPAWSRPPRHRGPVALLAETVGEAFVRRALAQPGDVAVADRVSGVLTYRRLLVGAKLLSQPLGQLPGRGGRRHAAGLGGCRPGLFRPAPGRQVAGDDELDHRPSQPGTRRPEDEHPPCGDRPTVDRSTGDHGGGRGAGVSGRTAGPDRQVPGAADAVGLLSRRASLAASIAPCRPRRPGRRAVHFRFGERSQSGAAQPSQCAPQRARRDRRAGDDA